MGLVSVMIGLRQLIFDATKTFANSTQISYTSAGTITFEPVDNAPGGIDHIHDSAGQFVIRGFKDADIIEAKNSASNDSVLFNIVSVSATRLEVASLGIMTAEVGGAGAVNLVTPLASAVYGFPVGDHGLLSGLLDDDHVQYVLANGTRNIATASGMKIGTAASDQLGFFNQTPVNQPDAVADATSTSDVVAQLNALIARMRELGLIAT